MSKRKINISDIFDEANNENVTVLPKSETLYNIDYSEFEVNEDEKQTLIKCEHDISHHLKILVSICYGIMMPFIKLMKYFQIIKQVVGVNGLKR